MTIKIPSKTIEAKEIEIKDIIKIIKGTTNGKSWQLMVINKEYQFDLNVQQELQAEFNLEVYEAKKK